MARFLAMAVNFRESTWLGMFGASTPKALKLYASDPWVHHLKRRLVRKNFSKSTTTRRYIKDGRKRFAGTASLKATQVYTKSFGCQVGFSTKRPMDMLYATRFSELLHVYAYIYIYICMCACVYACMYACICMHVYVCMYMYACICMHVYVCMYMYACICTHVYACMYM